MFLYFKELKRSTVKYLHMHCFVALCLGCLSELMCKSVKLAAELHLIKNIWRAVEIFPVVVMGGSRDGLRSQERS